VFINAMCTCLSMQCVRVYQCNVYVFINAILSTINDYKFKGSLYSLLKASGQEQSN